MHRTPPKGSGKSEDGAWGVVEGIGDLEKVWENKEVCVMCRKRVNSGECGINCDMCKRWFHPECQKIKKKDYEMLNRIEKVWWYCNRCSEKVDGAGEKQRELLGRVVEVEEVNKRLRRENEEIRANMEKLELKMDRMDREAKELSKKLKRDVEGEMEDRLKEIEREFIKKQEAEIKGIRRDLENVNKDSCLLYTSDAADE